MSFDSMAGALARLKTRRKRAEETHEESQDEQREVGAIEKDVTEAFVKRTKVSMVWECTVCKRVCIPIRDESRCICGHRLKHHGPLEVGKAPACKEKNCACKAFFYIVAEGSWILRCRCKHKHTDHDPVTHRCRKPNCTACPPSGFDSPFVCNCNHGWAQHVQRTIETTVLVPAALAKGTNASMPIPALDPGVDDADLQGWNAVQRGIHEDEDLPPASR